MRERGALPLRPPEERSLPPSATVSMLEPRPGLPAPICPPPPYLLVDRETNRIERSNPNSQNVILTKGPLSRGRLEGGHGRDLACGRPARRAQERSSAPAGGRYRYDSNHGYREGRCHHSFVLSCPASS